MADLNVSVLEGISVAEQFAARLALVLDSFTDTNGTLLPAHTPDFDLSGGGWLTIGTLNSLQINGNLARAASSTNGELQGNVIETSASDVEVDVSMTLVNASVTYPTAIILRYTDDANYLRVNIIPSSNTVYLQEFVAGNLNTIKPTPYLTGTGFPGLPLATSNGMSLTVRVRAEGSDVTIQVGDRKLTYKDVTNHQTATKHGIFGGNRTAGTNSSKFDNFAVYALADLETQDPVTWFYADHGVYLLDGSLASQSSDRPCLWLDKSNRGHSAVNHISIEFASYDPTGYNGLPAVQFAMVSSQNLQYAAPAAKTGGITIFALLRIPAYTPSSAHHDPFRLTTVGPTTGVGSGGNDDDRLATMLYDLDDLLHFTFMEDANTYDYVSGLAADGQWHLMAWTIDFAAGTSIIRVDKTEVNTKTALPAPDHDYRWGSIGSALLGAYAIDMFAREFRVYDRAMTGVQMAAIEDEIIPPATSTLSVSVSPDLPAYRRNRVRIA